MAVRPLLVLTALISSFLGAVAVYLVLTVPNDVQARVLLKQAQTDIGEGDEEHARLSLSEVVQQYPRTDAAAAAAVALATLEARDRQKLAHEVAVLQRTVNAQTLRLDALAQKVNTPPPPPAPSPAPVIAAPPEPDPAPAKKKATPPTHRSRKRH